MYIKKVLDYILSIISIIIIFLFILNVINIEPYIIIDKDMSDYEKALIKAAKEINMKSEYLYQVIYIESEHIHDNVNPKSDAYGLIQVMKSTLAELHLTRYEIEQMDKFEQIDKVVIPYFNNVKKQRKIKKFDTLLDCYLAIFYPVAINKELDFILGSTEKNPTQRIKRIAEQNSLFDTNKDKKITKQEIKDYLDKYEFPTDKTKLLNL